MYSVAGDSALKVLVLAPQPFWPPNNGAKLRNYHLVRSLATEARVTYLSFVDGTEAHARPSESLCNRVIAVKREGGYSLSKVVRGAAGPRPLGVLNYTTTAMTRRLSKLLGESDFDVVQIEGGHLSAYIPTIRAARNRPMIVCDWHNVESELMSRYADNAQGIARRLYARRTARLWRNEERRLLRLADAHIVVTERDRQHLIDCADAGARVFVIENGVDVAHFSSAGVDAGSSRQRNRIVFVGSMDYHANIDAAVPFARYVWPQLLRRHPGSVFTVIGRNPSPIVRSLGDLPGVEVTGTVDDVRPYYREAIAAVVPLRVGGGSRLKILEAMAAGVPVVSTPLGAEGLEVTDGQNIRIARGANEMFGHLSELIAEPRLAWRLAVNGRALVKGRYDWASIGKTHLNALRTIVGTNTSPISVRGFVAVAAEA